MILGFCNIKDSMLNYGFWSIYNLNCLYKVYCFVKNFSSLLLGVDKN